MNVCGLLLFFSLSPFGDAFVRHQKCFGCVPRCGIISKLTSGRLFLKIRQCLFKDQAPPLMSALKAGPTIPVFSWYSNPGKFQCPINKPGQTIKFTFLLKVGLAWKMVPDNTKLWKSCLIILHKNDLINIIEGVELIILQTVYTRIPTPNYLQK